MCRRVFNFASACSLLLCIATLALWVGTFGKSKPHLLIGNLTGYSPQVLAVRSEAGFLTFYWITQPQHPFRLSTTDSRPDQSAYAIVWLWTLRRDTGPLSRLGFDWIQFSPQELRSELPALSRLILAGCPHWSVALLFATPPALWLYRRIKRQPIGPARCQQWSYVFPDLQDHKWVT